MLIYKKPINNKNWLATIAIGNKYLIEWEKHALPTWKIYADKYNFGIVVFEDDIISRDNKTWKKATWQKLLIGSEMNKYGFVDGNILYLDTDILISPLANNIFEVYNTKKIAVVSLINNLVQPRELTLRRLAFLRHTYWDNRYPLDSALFLPHKKIFEYHGLKPFDDFFCAGLFVFNISNHSKIMKKWFEKYNCNMSTITHGDQTHVNYEFQKWGNLQWLPYRYQALWTYEIAWHYPFLFKYSTDEKIIRECIEASLYKNDFLHFAGSWNENQMWKIGDFFLGENSKQDLMKYSEYLDEPVKGEPKGMIKPIN